MDGLQSHYRINIAKAQDHQVLGEKVRYKHHFAIDIIHQQEAMDIFVEMTENYPAPTYNIEVTYWNIGGKSMDWGTESKPKE
jgi:hypothetical protein